MARWNPKEPVVVDVYEGEYPVDLANLNPYLCIFRASAQYQDGSRREDHRAQAYSDECKALGIKRGMYHFLRPNGIAEQAALFLSVWDRLQPELRPVVDVEINVDSLGIGRATWAHHVKTFIELVEAHTGLSPIIYTSVYFWEFTGKPSWAANYDLWAAWYPDSPDNYAYLPDSRTPQKFRRTGLWQYADDGRTQGYLANDYNMISEWLLEELGEDPPPPPPPPDEEWEGTTLTKVGVWRTPVLRATLRGARRRGLKEVGKLVEGDGILWLNFGEKRYLPVRMLDGSETWVTLKKVTSTVEPVPDNEFIVPSDGWYCQGLHDFQTEEWSYKSRVIKLNFKKGALPETIPLTSHPEFTPLSRAWQEWLFECLKRASKNTMTHDQLIQAWISLVMDGRSHFDDHAPENGYIDYITGRNLGSSKGPIAIKTLGMGGNLYKLAQSGFYGTRYLIETLDGTKPPPPIDEVWGKQWLIQWATESGPQNAEGVWICGRFPQLKPFGTPIPLISSGVPVYISRDRVQRMEAGMVYSPYHPPTA